MSDDEFVGREYYGGLKNKYECIKVILAWDLDFPLGCVLKYISRAGKKEGEDAISDLKKARAYLDYEIAMLEGKGSQKSADP